MSGDEAEDRFIREIQVAGDFTEAIDAEVISQIGWPRGLDDYEWPLTSEQEDGEWPFVVVRDGREYEIDIDVHATELTDEVKAKRAADEAALRRAIATHGGEQS